MKLRKRPASLLPPSYFSKYNIFSMIYLQFSSMIVLNSLIREKEIRPIVGPPSSCKDLNELGHTLNGIYMVSKRSSNSTIQDRSEILPVRAVFCDFRVLDENPSLPGNKYYWYISNTCFTLKHCVFKMFHQFYSERKQSRFRGLEIGWIWNPLLRSNERY